MPLKVFVDFDGTISRDDVGNAFFRHFGGERCDEIVGRYRAGLIPATRCLEEEADACGEFPFDEAVDFARRQEVDPGFRAFTEFCCASGISLTILSDGLDFYIHHILQASGITGVPVFSNRASFHAASEGKSTLSVGFPFTDAECRRCACCKRNIMVTRSAEDDVTVYIGEGYSDMCPVQYADIVFAKRELQTFCQENNISYFHYGSFSDVTPRLEQLANRKRLPHRQQAVMMRRQLFIAE